MNIKTQLEGSTLIGAENCSLPVYSSSSMVESLNSAIIRGDLATQILRLASKVLHSIKYDSLTGSRFE